MKAPIIKLLFSAVFVMMTFSASAVEPDEQLQDPKLEERARTISANLRCVVCLNQSIDSSDAGVARDLRLLVRKRLVLGDSDEEVFDYVVQRYGDFVLLKPPFKSTTYLLWLAPFVLGGIGLIVVVCIIVNSKRELESTSEPLSTEESERLTQANLDLEEQNTL